MTHHIAKIIIFLLFFCSCGASAKINNPIDSLMNLLDEVLADRDRYIIEKETNLRNLRQRADTTSDKRARFDVLGWLADEYNTFNTDSAYSICMERQTLAEEIGDSVLLMNAYMNRANIMSATAMYKETIELMDSIKCEKLPDYLLPYYFYIKRTVYGRLADFSAFPSEKKRYARLTEMYRDSLLRVNADFTLAHIITRADQLNADGKPKEALELLDRFMEQNNLSEHDVAICAWTQAESYSLLGDNENLKRELLVSSISDIKSSVREYISLRQLALLLYQEGDLERAYRFMSVALDDAAKCNARQRIVELSAYYPMINDIYVEKIQSHKKSLSWTIVIITILTLIMLVLLLYTRKQMRRVAEARKNVQLANEKLHNLNDELHDINKKLRDANRDIADISEMKEVYIGRYMDQCLEYIDKLDSYRKHLNKLFISGKSDELRKSLKTTRVIEEELKAFYDQFDKTFLSLFPSFVDDLNNLLMPGEEILPKKKGCLSPELRIFALIRLGITDSDRIAKFLRYSLSTIYNYRTRVRNKAKGDRNLLEDSVAKIGRK